MPIAAEHDTAGHGGESFGRLHRAKEDRLKELLGRRPGQKHYRRALKAYLEADSALQRAIIQRLGLDFRA